MTTAIGADFFNPLSEEFISNPYPTYEALRRYDPIHKSARGFWMLTRHRDISSALKEPALSNEPSHFAIVHPRNRDRYVVADVAANVINFMDPPRHGQYRKLILEAFRARMNNFPLDLNRIAAERLDGFRDIGEIDLVSDFGTPFSLSVVRDFVGLTEQESDNLKAWSDQFFYVFNKIPSKKILDDVNQALSQFRDYLFEIVELRRRNPTDDLISCLIAAGDSEFRMNDVQIADTAMLFFSAGVENVDSGVANCILSLLRHDDQLRLLTARPELMDNAIDECLRYEALSQFVPRIAKEDVEIEGATIQKHEVVLLALASANRDTSVFSNPDQIEIERGNVKHMAFGRGRHSCVGAPLVLKEYRSAIGAILQRLKKLTATDANPRWTSSMGHRWLQTLNVRFEPF